jgi:hypothetical protein
MREAIVPYGCSVTHGDSEVVRLSASGDVDSRGSKQIV